MFTVNKILSSAVVVSTVHLTLPASLSFAGTRDGGGGVGVRCAAGTGAPKPFELLDLHEARVRGSKVSYDPQAQGEAVDLTANLISRHFWNPATIPMAEYRSGLAANIIEPLFSGRDFPDYETGKSVHVEFVPSLPLSNDIGSYHITPGCQLEQVAYFDDTSETLQIATANWQSLDWLDKSALIAHEINYLMYRRDGLENFPAATHFTSEQTRRFVGALFSQAGVTPKSDTIPDNGYLTCGANSEDISKATNFWAFTSGPNEVTMVFSLLQGRMSLYQTKIVLNGATLEAILDRENGEAAFQVPVQLVDEPRAPMFTAFITKVKGASPKLEVYSSEAGKQIPMGLGQPFNCR